MEPLNIVGYITSNAFSDGFVSHQIQNAAIKNYIASKKKNLLLSWTEYKGNLAQVFESLLQEIFYQGICFYSLDQIEQMPNPEKALKILKDRNIWIGFAKEQIFFNGEDGFHEVRKLMWLKAEVEKSQSEKLWEI